MAWTAIFYGIVTVSLLWLLFSCCWACIRLFTTPETVTVEIDDDTASYVSARVPMDYMMAHIYRDSLRLRNANENGSESDSLESSGSDNKAEYGNDPNSREGNGSCSSSDTGDKKHDSKDDSGIKSNADAEEKDSKNDSGSSGNETAKGGKGDNDSGINTSKADREEIIKKDDSKIVIIVTGDSGIKPKAVTNN